MVISRPVFACALLLAGLMPGPVQDAGAPGPSERRADPSPSNDWPEPYTFIHVGFVVRGRIAEVRAALPFSRIVLERRPGNALGPSFRAVLMRDGRASYEGLAHDSRPGPHTGSVDMGEYGRLCHLAERSGFEEMESEYIAARTCSSRTWLSVDRDDGGVISVLDYGGYGPIELWGLQQAVDAVIARIDWTRVSGVGEDQVSGRSR